MLPNHAPLVIAEQFGTLESLYPGRIDLGLGRAPGGDMRDRAALRARPPRQRRHLPPGPAGAHGLLPPGRAGQRRARGPRRGAGRARSGSSGRATSAPGSPPSSGLPFAFASHFAPDFLHGPSPSTAGTSSRRSGSTEPYAMVGVNVFAADTDAEARRLFTSLQQQFLNLVRGRPRQLPPPVESMDGRWSEPERSTSSGMTARLGGRLAGDGTAPARRDRGGDRGRRADPRHPGVRPRGEAEVVRARGTGPPIPRPSPMAHPRRRPTPRPWSRGAETPPAVSVLSRLTIKGPFETHRIHLGHRQSRTQRTRHTSRPARARRNNPSGSREHPLGGRVCRGTTTAAGPQGRPRVESA